MKEHQEGVGETAVPPTCFSFRRLCLCEKIAFTAFFTGRQTKIDIFLLFGNNKYAGDRDRFHKHTVIGTKETRIYPSVPEIAWISI